MKIDYLRKRILPLRFLGTAIMDFNLSKSFVSQGLSAATSSYVRSACEMRYGPHTLFQNIWLIIHLAVSECCLIAVSHCVVITSLHASCKGRDGKFEISKVQQRRILRCKIQAQRELCWPVLKSTCFFVTIICNTLYLCIRKFSALSIYLSRSASCSFFAKVSVFAHSMKMNWKKKDTQLSVSSHKLKDSMLGGYHDVVQNHIFIINTKLELRNTEDLSGKDQAVWCTCQWRNSRLERQRYIPPLRFVGWIHCLIERRYWIHGHTMVAEQSKLINFILAKFDELIVLLNVKLYSKPCMNELQGMITTILVITRKLQACIDLLISRTV